MITKRQATHLRKLVDRVAHAEADHYFQSDQGSRESALEAAAEHEKANNAFEKYLNRITER